MAGVHVSVCRDLMHCPCLMGAVPRERCPARAAWQRPPSNTSWQELVTTVHSLCHMHVLQTCNCIVHLVCAFCNVHLICALCIVHGQGTYACQATHPASAAVTGVTPPTLAATSPVCCPPPQRRPQRQMPPQLQEPCPLCAGSPRARPVHTPARQHGVISLRCKQLEQQRLCKQQESCLFARDGYERTHCTHLQLQNGASGLR